MIENTTNRDILALKFFGMMDIQAINWVCSKKERPQTFVAFEARKHTVRPKILNSSWTTTCWGDDNAVQFDQIKTKDRGYW